jgi:hypothetical protein
MQYFSLAPTTPICVEIATREECLEFELGHAENAAGFTETDPGAGGEQQSQAQVGFIKDNKGFSGYS